MSLELLISSSINTHVVCVCGYIICWNMETTRHAPTPDTPPTEYNPKDTEYNVHSSGIKYNDSSGMKYKKM